MDPGRGLSVPSEMQPTFEELVRLTDAFAQEHLNEDYAHLFRELAAALCRKRPSPVLQGKLSLWAGGIISAIGSVNFLNDRNSVPYMAISEIGPLLGVSSSNVAARFKKIREDVRMSPLDPRWSLPELKGRDPIEFMLRRGGSAWAQSKLQSKIRRRLLG